MSQPNPMHIRPFMSPSGPMVPPDDHESIPLTEASDRLVEKGINAARANHPAEAINLFDQALAINEDNVEALLWRGGLSEPNASLPFLEHAVALEPSNQRARDGLEWARQRVGLAPVRTVASAPPARPAASPTPPIVRQYVQPVQVTYGPRVQQTPPPVQATAPVRAYSAPSGANAYQTVIAPARPAVGQVSGGPDIFGMLVGAVTFLIERPTMALIIAIIVLAMLGTAAIARAGMSRNEPAPQPTPQVLISNGKAGAPANPASGASSAAASGPVTTTTAISVAVTSAATLDQAWSANDWPQVLMIINDMLRRKPGDPELMQKLLSAHYNYGVQLVRSERLAEAIDEFDKALAINASDTNVLSEKRFASLYLDGSTALAKGDFASAIPPLRQIVDSNSSYRSAKSRLYQSYIGYADSLEKEGKKSDAYTYYQKASKVDTQGQEAQAGMTRLKDSAPAVVLGKKIEVDLVKQQVIMWDNNKAIYKFKASTGRAPGVTRSGDFEILNKMPNAYSSSMSWGMPYWMGIYQAGGSENGFHAMARLANGTVLSTSVLGRPATNGCIMLSDADARTLYNWAVLGTPVWIH